SDGDRGEPCWARNTTRPAKRLWKSRSVEKSQTRLFHRAWKSRKERAIPTFPQPRRRRVFGYISNVSTIDPRVTFLNGLTRTPHPRLLVKFRARAYPAQSLLEQTSPKCRSLPI